MPRKSGGDPGGAREGERVAGAEGAAPHADSDPAPDCEITSAEQRLRAKYFAPGADAWKAIASERLARAFAGRYSETRDPLDARRSADMSDDALDALLEEMIVRQRAKVVAVARRIDPRATFDDTLQPHDNPAIHANPLFQFEDGLLAGLLAAQAAIRARRGDAPPGLAEPGPEGVAPA